MALVVVVVICVLAKCFASSSRQRIFFVLPFMSYYCYLLSYCHSFAVAYEKGRRVVVLPVFVMVAVVVDGA